MPIDKTEKIIENQFHAQKVLRADSKSKVKLVTRVDLPNVMRHLEF